MSCTTCAKFMHCTKNDNLKGCSSHRDRVVIQKNLERTDLEKKLDTLELAIEERAAISKRFDFSKGNDFIELNDDLTAAYTKTISKINTELFEKYGILSANYGEKIPKDEILAKFDEEVESCQSL